MSSRYCLRCNRVLSALVSVTHGYGPKCWKKVSRTYDADIVPDPVTITDHELARISRSLVRAWLLTKGKRHECWCGTPFKECEYITSDHEGGVALKGYGKPQWIVFKCPKCYYETAWWKLQAGGLPAIAVHVQDMNGRIINDIREDIAQKEIAVRDPHAPVPT